MSKPALIEEIIIVPCSVGSGYNWNITTDVRQLVGWSMTIADACDVIKDIVADLKLESQG